MRRSINDGGSGSFDAFLQRNIKRGNMEMEMLLPQESGVDERCVCHQQGYKRTICQSGSYNLQTISLILAHR